MSDDSPRSESILAARSIPRRIAVAVAAPAIGLLLRIPMEPLVHQRLPYITLFPAVMFAAWYGGFWAGILATVVSGVGVLYFVLPPARALAVDSIADAFGLGTFALIGVGFSFLAESLHRSVQRAGRIAGDKERLLAEVERAREKAEQERARLLATFMHSPAHISVLRGEQHVYEYVNESRHELAHGRDLLGRPFAEVNPELVEQGVLDVIDQVYRTGTMYVGTEQPFMLRNAQGVIEQTFYNLTIQPVRDDAGVIEGVLIFGYEVGDLVRARRRAEKSANRLARLQALTEALADARSSQDVAKVVVEHGVAAAGADTCTIMGLTDDGNWLEMLGQHGVAAEVAAAIGRVSRKGQNPSNDALESGEPVWVESAEDYARRYPELANRQAEGPRAEAFWCVPLFAGARTLGVLGMGFYQAHRFDDETRAFTVTLGRQCAQALDRVRSWEAERKANRRLRVIAEASRLLGETLEYETTLANLARSIVPDLADWCSIDLLEPGDTIPKAVAIAHVDPAKVQQGYELRAEYPMRADDPTGIMNVLRTGEPELYSEIPDELLVAGARDARHLRLSRALGLQSAMVVPLHARGRTLGAITFVSSREDLRYGDDDLRFAVELAARAALAIENARLHRDAQAAIQLRDEFLSIASHELNTPLTPLKIQLASVRRGGKSPEQTAEKLATAERMVDRLASLVRQLLDVSRIAAGRLALEPEQVDLVPLVEECVSRLGDALARSGSTLTLDADPRAIVGRWDPLRLDQIVTNLVTNALKYGEGKPVVVTLRTVDGSAVIAVRDHGIGIDREHQARIFGRFERAVSTRHFGGFGLGLWIVRQIVEASGGDVRVESEKGEGAMFTVRLPLFPVAGETT